MNMRSQLPTTVWKINVRQDVAAEVESRLFNPALGKPIYGARARLIETLLTKWLRDQATNPTPEPPIRMPSS